MASQRIESIRISDSTIFITLKNVLTNKEYQLTLNALLEQTKLVAQLAKRDKEILMRLQRDHECCT